MGTWPITIKHSVQAFLNEKIILFLSAIAMNHEAAGILLQSREEVEDNAMGHARANDVSEAVHPSTQAIDVAERRDQRFTRRLPSAIGRYGQDRANGLGHRLFRRQVAINCAARRENHVSNTRPPHGIQYVEGSDDAIFQVALPGNRGC